MTTETRYMRSDTDTINGLTAYKLGLSLRGQGLSETRVQSGYLSVTWGFRAWIRDSSGTETEVTNGTPQALVTKAAGDIGNELKSNTWTNTVADPMNPTDSIVVRIYLRFGSGAWQLLTTFTTEQLGAQSLDVATWTVYYMVGLDYDEELNITTGTYYWDLNIWNSHIENFTWTIAVPKPSVVGLHPSKVLSILLDD